MPVCEKLVSSSGSGLRQQSRQIFVFIIVVEAAAAVVKKWKVGTIGRTKKAKTDENINVSDGGEREGDGYGHTEKAEASEGEKKMPKKCF